MPANPSFERSRARLAAPLVSRQALGAVCRRLTGRLACDRQDNLTEDSAIYSNFNLIRL